jgi:hypothetical protein
MKTIAFYALHHGRDYLAWSIRSLQDVVDEILVYYSPSPSFGPSSDVPCPHTRDELFLEANRFLKDKKKLTWVDGHWGGQNAHRAAGDLYAKEHGYDTLVSVDADEVWDTEALKDALDVAGDRPTKSIRCRFLHLWRSFKWGCTDVHMPIKITNLNKKGEWYFGHQKWPVYHFGYAVPSALMPYKMEIHGHKKEWRADWLEKKYLAWKPDVPMEDAHPTCRNFWKPHLLPPREFDRLNLLVGDHPYAHLEVIP